MSTKVQELNIENITRGTKNINTSISSHSSPSTSISSSPAPSPLTPNTQEYCMNNLCYAPPSKPIKNLKKLKKLKL